jgi:hypothetical protein
MQIVRSQQYGINCVVVGPGVTAQQVIDVCREEGAVREVDGVEFCVELRPEVGPELWTEESLRRSLVVRGEVPPPGDL